MDVQINAVHFAADGKLKTLIDDRLQKLIKYYDRLLSVNVFLKLENSGQVKDKIVELQANLPGKVLFASASNKSFEASLDEAQEIMVRQLKRSKQKLANAG